MSKNNQPLEIDWSVQPYTQKWNGGLHYHPYKNYVFGARCVENTKSIFNERLEEFQRKMKALKKAKVGR